MIEKNKERKNSYNETEMSFLKLAVTIGEEQVLRASTIAEMLSGFFPNRTTKAIELRIGNIIRDMKANGKLPVVQVEEIPETPKNVISDEPLKEEVEFDPYSLALSLLNQQGTPLLSNEGSIAVGKSSSDYNSNSSVEEKKSVLKHPVQRDFNTNNRTGHRTLPYFNTSHIGKTFIVKVNNVLPEQRRYFADNDEFTGLGPFAIFSKPDLYVPFHERINHIKRGSVLKVEIVADQYISNRVVLQPVDFDSNGLPILLTEKDFENRNNLDSEDNLITEKDFEDIEDLTVFSTTTKPVEAAIVRPNYFRMISCSDLPSSISSDDDLLEMFYQQIKVGLISTSISDADFAKVSVSKDINKKIENSSINITFDVPLSDEQIIIVDTVINDALDFVQQP